MTKRRIAGALVLLLAATAYGYRYMPSGVADALKRGDAWVAAHPQRAEGYFFLGRINGSAWAKGTVGDSAKVSIASFGDGESPPFFVPWDSVMLQRDPKLEVTAEAQQYLTASMAAYQKAVDIEPKNPVYQLALGWALEQAGQGQLKPAEAGALTPEEIERVQRAKAQLGTADFAAREEAAKTLAALMPRDAGLLLAAGASDAESSARVAEIVKRYWLTASAAHYRAAYALTVEKDRKANAYDSEADATVSVQAGGRLLVILPALPGATADECAGIAAALKEIQAKPGVPHAY